jgi:hypothetical protein
MDAKRAGTCDPPPPPPTKSFLRVLLAKYLVTWQGHLSAPLAHTMRPVLSLTQTGVEAILSAIWSMETL